MEIQIALICEEIDEERKSFLDFLKKKKNVTVFLANDESQLLKFVRNEEINIVLADYYLKKTNPLTFLRKIKKIKPFIEVIFFAEEITFAKAIEVMKEGAYDFYEFPVNNKLLAMVISKAIEKQDLYIAKNNLEKKVKEKFNFDKIIGSSKAIRTLKNTVENIAAKNVNILITGETGTGKEMVANAIHFNSERASGPFIKVNCAAFNEGVLESELFGHEQGAFTGALAKRIGRFEMANEGTIFLDEIGDVPMSTQIKLLRILQEKEFERVGGNKTISVNVRVIAATNQNLKELIAEKKFREDLYYRLNVIHIEIPPLNERKDDIPLLASFFMNKLNKENGYGIQGITKESMQVLLNYQWPGNVRELENAIESAMATCKKKVIESKFLPSFLLLNNPETSDFFQIPFNLTLPEMEKEVIRLTLLRTNGNKTVASKLLGISLRTLQRKVNEPV
ncbi:MAG: sigma-54-dependent Fis family transcriptional regulator [Nitrospinae bacterium]|nr:sigma-54-dependent Fis family transcriptional regulator [Nitrospinota bacterium]